MVSLKDKIRRKRRLSNSTEMTVFGSGRDAHSIYETDDIPRLQSQRRKTYQSFGRGGAGNIRLRSVEVEYVPGPDACAPPIGRELSGVRSRNAMFTTGRGGAGNISFSRHPKQSPGANDDEMEKGVIRKNLELSRISKNASHSSGRGGVGNISNSLLFSRSMAWAPLAKSIRRWSRIRTAELDLGDPITLQALQDAGIIRRSPIQSIDETPEASLYEHEIERRSSLEPIPEASNYEHEMAGAPSTTHEDDGMGRRAWPGSVESEYQPDSAIGETGLESDGDTASLYSCWSEFLDRFHEIKDVAVLPELAMKVEVVDL